MRILALQTGFSLTAGGSRADYELLASLARLGHSIRVLMPTVSRSDLVLEEAMMSYMPVRGLGLPQSLGLFSLPWILQEARRFQPHIIRDHSPYAFALAALTAQRLCKVPAVGSFLHPEDRRQFAWVERNLLRRYAHITTISHFSAQQLGELDPAAVDKISVVHVGVSAEYAPRMVADEAAWRAARNLPVDGPLFCTAGALIRRKNFGFLVEVMQSWVEVGKSGALIIVGEGPEKERLVKTVRDRRLSANVRFWGYTRQDDYLELLSSATAFIFPSLLEGFGLAPAEALACGTPALVSDRGALPEVVKDGVTGYVLPIDQGPQPWVEAMGRLCDAPALSAQLGRAAVSDVRTRFNWERAGRDTAAVYARLIEGGRHSSVGKQ